MSLRRSQNNLYESVHMDPSTCAETAGHHVCDTSQLFHLLPRQKAGIKAGAVAATSVKDVKRIHSLQPVRRKEFISSVVHEKIIILHNSCYISKQNIYVHS